MIGSESEGTADRYAVEGAIQATGGSVPDRPRIIILRPNDQHVSFEQLRNDNPGLPLRRGRKNGLRWNRKRRYKENSRSRTIVAEWAKVHANELLEIAGS